MVCCDTYHIGHFGHVGREQAGRNFFKQVVDTGSLVLHRAGGNRAAEMSAHRFLSSPHVMPDEILQAAGRRTASA